MRKLGSYFSSEFLKASDLPAPRLLTISKVEQQEVGREKELKLVVSFEATEQGLVLNKTNAETIAEIAKSDDLDAWPGTQVVLYATMTDFSGRRVDCIRVRAPKTKAAKSATKQPEPNPAAEHQLQADIAAVEEEADDDCPF
jgi:hypothetical protein